MNQTHIQTMIEDAFRGFQMPQHEGDLDAGGIDGEEVLKNYLGLTREQVAARGGWGHLYTEEFSYMKPQGVGYYLPVIMVYMMEHCDDDVTWIYLGGYLRPRENGKIWWNLEALGVKAHQAVGVWAEWLAQRLLELDADVEAIQNAESIAAYYTNRTRGLSQ